MKEQEEEMNKSINGNTLAMHAYLAFFPMDLV